MDAINQVPWLSIWEQKWDLESLETEYGLPHIFLILILFLNFT